jgi:hypothetical protein
MAKVSLTYFKHSGKYYTEGAFTVATGTGYYDILEKVRKMLLDGKLPGLRDGSRFPFVLVQAEDHAPHLVTGEQVGLKEGAF